MCVCVCSCPVVLFKVCCLLIPLYLLCCQAALLYTTMLLYNFISLCVNGIPIQRAVKSFFHKDISNHTLLSSVVGFKCSKYLFCFFGLKHVFVYFFSLFYGLILILSLSSTVRNSDQSFPLL